MLHRSRTLLLVALSLAASAASAASAQALEGRLKRIAASKTIAIAHRTDAAPFSFVDARKEIAGFAVDLCRQVVASIEKQIGVPGLEIRWIPVTTQTRFDAIVKGQADMECGASTVTLSRMKLVDFSSFTFMETTGLLVKAAPGYQSLADLGGKRIAVIAGTTNERAVNEELKRRSVAATAVPMKDSQEAMGALEGGTVDAFASDVLLLVGAAGKAKDPKALALLNDKLSYEPYAIALPRGDWAFRLAVNTALAQIYRADAIDQLFSKWFGAFGKPTALTEAVYIFGAIPD